MDNLRREADAKQVHQSRCPNCGSKKIHVIRGDYQMRFRGKKLVVPNLERDECRNCGEILFSPKAMRQIESQRKQLAVK